MTEARKSDQRSMRTMTATATVVRLGRKKRRSRALQRPRTQQQARRPRSRSLERSSSEDISDCPRMPTASAVPVESSPQSPEQAPEPNQAAQDSYVSPEGQASVLTGSSKDFAGYLMSLQMRQRCTVVAYNDRGALCVAVATADESSAGLIMHVLACYILHLHVRPGIEDWCCCRRHSLSTSCVYRFHFAGHLLIRPNINASFCALAERCKIRSLLSRAWAHLQDLVVQVSAHSYCMGFAVNPTMEMAYNKLCLAVQSSSSSLIYAGMPEL